MKKYSFPNFAIYLKEYLERNYPEKSSDSQFIEQRNRLAQQTYLKNMEESLNHDLSMERAMEVLLKDYMFSKFDAIWDAICDDFPNTLLPDESASYINSLMDICDEVFQRHVICDNLLCGDEYLKLQQELRSVIASKKKQVAN